MSPQTGGQPVPPAADPHQGGWAGRGFSRPGPSAEVPTDLYRAALQDALAYTADRDGCAECDRAHLCETHASRASRAEQYQQALAQEMEADEDTDNQRMTSGSPITISKPRTGKAATWATQAVLNAINSGQLRAELLEDSEFWAARPPSSACRPRPRQTRALPSGSLRTGIPTTITLMA
jgi:hypothetical protein